MLTKICTKCGVEKGVDAYSKHPRGKHDVRAACKCCVAQYNQANKEAIAEQKKAHYEANKEAIAEQRKTFRVANKETIAERNKAYKQANPHIFNAISAKRKATKFQATPAWADLEAIKGIYLLASLNREGGHDLHVGHIVPLQSDMVCGLHCEANLQLMPASDNISKGNRRWPAMP